MRGGTIFKPTRLRRPLCLRDAGGYLRGDVALLRSWSFFWKLSLKWSNLLHYHVKHLTACLLGCLLLLNRMVKKMEGCAPPSSEKWRGTGPPGSAAYVINTSLTLVHLYSVEFFTASSKICELYVTDNLKICI